jgi:uncharacterized protein YjeT (DUF2065 family)
MGLKLLWGGLTFIEAVPAAVRVFGGQPNDQALIFVGAVIMVIGLVLFWLNK